MSPRFDHGDYTIGWICALPKEMTAAIAMLDVTHDSLPQPASDYNNYCLGSIGEFNIAIAGLPGGDIGSHPASAVAIRMVSTFPNLKIGLMVGIGGGVPSKEHDIRLGDVVVSIPANGFGGVVQHDMGKNTKDGGWVRTGSLNGPPSVLRTTISKLMSMHQIHGNKIEIFLSEMVERHPNLSPQFTRQDTYSDTLYEPEPEEPGAFQGWVEVERQPRKPHELIKIHYGLIASGNQVIKSGRLRDQISSRLGGVLCFEMEAAGLMNELPCVVIRGICDYADAHKNKEWQEYAAAVAAAYTKELVTALPTISVEKQASRETQAPTPIIQDHFVTVQSQSLGPHWMVPFFRNQHFVAREQELSTLRRWSSSEELCHSMAIFGLGGVGKTQIALEFAYRTKDENPNCSVFWVPATDRLAFEHAYKQIGHLLNIPGIDANGADVLQLVKDGLSDKGAGQWLMIIDNADDINMIFRQPSSVEVSAPALIDYVPFSPNGSTLITTRNRKVAVRQAANKIIFLEIMGPDDAKQLLERSLLRQEILSDVNVTMELLRILGFLPLAIIHAASYINENDTTIEDYTSLYNDSETEVMKVLSEDFEVHGRYKTVKNSIAATWLISLSQLTRTNPVAIDYLSFMACLSNNSISQSLLLPVESKKQSLEAVGALKAYSFIRKREDGPSFDIHPLVHLASRNWLRNESKLQMWTDKAIVRLVDLLPDGGHDNRAIWTAYLPHAKYLLTSAIAVEGKLQVVVLAEKLAKCLYSNGEYNEAYHVYERALDLRTKASGLENRDTLRNMFGMAEALDHQGKFKQAEHLHREILELRKKVLGPKDPEVGRSMNYLAQALYDDGNYAESERVHRDALALQNEVLHPEHPNALTTTGYLAQTLGQQGKYVEAEEMHRNLLKTRLRVAGEEYPGTLATMSCLGVAQGDLGNYADAEQTHRRVLGLRVKVLGDRHPHTAITKRWLADALLHQGKYEEAFRLNQEALGLQLELLGPMHPNTILALGNLGDILFYQGQTDRAEEVYSQVLDRQIKVLGTDHPETLGGMKRIADVLDRQGKHVEAKEMYRKVFEARAAVLGPRHPKTLATPH
ncbi:TPR-like protein [Annulohypoxylon maeteangense]|uniref:TPR-like protein n=1 Tax=Annulohypoxylon maeteangense TaxID=1927788 RepID=UPI002007B262|nr:TPR-like protein [Annulohypoxylon maeteangense]KAI0886603.1 TPR-like protein [Annulohypoxylon maeteangense]